MKAQLPKDKYFYINTKEEMVAAMEEPIKAAINMIIDKLQDRVDAFDIIKNERELTEQEVKEQKDAATSIITYTQLKDKIVNKKELTAIDFNLVALVGSTTAELMMQQSKNMKDAANELSKISWKIIHSKFNQIDKEDNKE